MTVCKICSGQDVVPVMNLGMQPWCNGFLTEQKVHEYEAGMVHEPHFPLLLGRCNDCTTLQLIHNVPSSFMFSNHTYLSGTTKSLNAHFKKMAEHTVIKALKRPGQRLNVLDIGSNDGTQLKHYRDLGCNVTGVDPCARAAEIAERAGITTYLEFFDERVGETLEPEQFDIINAAGVYFHIPDVHSFTRGVSKCLGKDGVFVVQFLYIGSILDNCAFDQIYHEHTLYYTLKTVQAALATGGIEVFDAELLPIHGGTMVVYAQHDSCDRPTSNRVLELEQQERIKGYNTLERVQQFVSDVDLNRHKNLAYLHSKRAQGKTIWGLGAPAKSTTLLHVYGIGSNLLDCLTEKNELRRGMYAPGTHLPIVMDGDITDHPDVYYVLAWNFYKEIVTRMKGQGVKSEFFAPIRP